jgi:phage-related holin
MRSLIPTLKYPGSGTITVIMSSISVPIIRIFGLDGFAFACLILIFMVELVSGIWASKIKGESFDSWKLSRFTFKVFYYLVIIAICYLMAESFKSRGKETAVVIFDFMHLFFTVQIVLENIVSISENYSVISGKPKSHFITTLVDKVNGFFK